MIQDYLNERTIAVGQEAADRNEAIRICGQLLVDNDCVKPEYTEDMIRSLDELGPYIVLSPGIAFAHARPSELVLKDSVSLITLKTPVPFGNTKNDPVYVLFAIAASENKHHLSVMKEISRLIMRDDFLEDMRAMTSVDEVIAYIQSK